MQNILTLCCNRNRKVEKNKNNFFKIQLATLQEAINSFISRIQTSLISGLPQTNNNSHGFCDWRSWFGFLKQGLAETHEEKILIKLTKLYNRNQSRNKNQDIN